jgi:hypothetical protein
MGTYRRIPLRLLDGSRQKANAYGNNAGWLCPCDEPLVGRSSSSYKYECHCGRSYQVVAHQGNLKPPDEVLERMS